MSNTNDEDLVLTWNGANIPEDDSKLVLWKQLTNTQFHDFEIKVNGETITANKSVVAQTSDVLSKILYGTENFPLSDEVSMDAYNLQSVRDAVHFLYMGTLGTFVKESEEADKKEIEGANKKRKVEEVYSANEPLTGLKFVERVVEVCKVGDYWNVKGLTSKCAKLLMERENTDELYLIYGTMHSKVLNIDKTACGELMAKCLQRIGITIGSYAPTTHPILNNGFEGDLLAEILGQKDLHATEETLADILLAWYKAVKVDPLKLGKKINFHHVLADKVKHFHDEGLISNEDYNEILFAKVKALEGKGIDKTAYKDLRGWAETFDGNPTAVKVLCSDDNDIAGVYEIDGTQRFVKPGKIDVGGYEDFSIELEYVMKLDKHPWLDEYRWIIKCEESHNVGLDVGTFFHTNYYSCHRVDTAAPAKWLEWIAGSRGDGTIHKLAYRLYDAKK